MAVVVKGVGYILVHVPDFVRYGSKPVRDIEEDGTLLEKVNKSVRSYADAVNYAPNQVFIGNMHPDELRNVAKPWYGNLLPNGERKGKFGEIYPEDEFYAWLKIADDFNLILLEPEFTKTLREKIAADPFMTEKRKKKLGDGFPMDKIMKVIGEEGALPLYYKEEIIGAIKRDHDNDDTLKANVLLENMVSKASGSLAMLHLMKQASMKPEEVDFVLDCTEEAIGDRYQRGGGSMSKAMAEFCDCMTASGCDIRAFCCAPNHAIVNAAGLVESGIHNNVIVAGGGCLAKAGMKYTAHLQHNMPILEDVIGAIAILIAKDDGVSPKIRLDAIGKHDVGAGSPQQAIMTALITRPLKKIGMKMMDIDKYSTELHNPEVTLPAGSGDTPATNYKIMAALAVMNKEIDKTQMEQFIFAKGMPGYAPTQGHVPSAVPFMGHALDDMKQGKINRAMFVAKGSLFLGRMSQLSDGISYILERQGIEKNS
ncbi:MAG: glycine/sarcosine/betaine reductase complex component C subunit beta [Syntrophales bacterium]|nr:glycine/sarcosine/betaine reductase complex component C subunit beta [Syntrophales bacterium]